MPIFEYSCLKCGFRFEKVQQPEMERETTCMECGSSEVKKEPSSCSTGTSSSPASFSGG